MKRFFLFVGKTIPPELYLDFSDVVTCIYLWITAPLVLWPTVFYRGIIVRCVIALLIAVVWPMVSATGLRRHNVLFIIVKIARLWYIPFVWVYGYSELGVLVTSVYGKPESTRYYDEVVLDTDYYAFGGGESMPPSTLRDAITPHNHIWIRRIVGEYLHGCYFAFYFIIATTVLSAAILSYRRKTRRVWTGSLAALSLTFYVCFCTYILWPVKGPYYTLEKADPIDVGFYVSRLVHKLLNSESSCGTATPSSHCAVAAACWVLWMLMFGIYGFIGGLFVVPGLIFATVWCGFHYATDAYLGTGIGVVMAAAAWGATQQL